MPRAKKDQQKVPTLKKTTGHWPSTLMGKVIRGDEDGTKPAELEPVSWRIALYDQGLSSHQSYE